MERKSPTKQNTKSSKTLENDPRYPLAMLQTTFELKQKSNPHFRNILQGMLEGLDISAHEFETYLNEYRDDLRRQCKLKGYL